MCQCNVGHLHNGNYLLKYNAIYNAFRIFLSAFLKWKQVFHVIVTTFILFVIMMLLLLLLFVLLLLLFFINARSSMTRCLSFIHQKCVNGTQRCNSYLCFSICERLQCSGKPTKLLEWCNDIWFTALITATTTNTSSTIFLLLFIKECLVLCHSCCFRCCRFICIYYGLLLQ